MCSVRDQWCVAIVVASLILVVEVASADDSAAGELTSLFHSFSPINRKVAVRESPDFGGYGVYAVEAVKSGEHIMSLPILWSLCDAFYALRPYGAALASAGLGEQDRMVVALVIESEQASVSPLFKWMRTMPKPGATNAVYVWSDSEIRNIEPRAARNEAQSTKSTVLSDFRRVRDVLRKLSSDVFGVVTEKRYLWARSCVESRAWNLFGKKYLFPVADMFNHALDDEDLSYDPIAAFGKGRSQKFLRNHKIIPPTGSSKFSSVDTAFEKGGVGALGWAYVYSDRNTGAETELFESYGDNSNGIYFTYHGFVAENNPYDCHNVDFKPIAGRKVELLRKYNVPQKVCVHGYKKLNRQFYAYFIVAAMTNDELNECLAQDSRHPVGCVSAATRMKALKAIRKELKQSLRRQNFRRSLVESKKMVEELIASGGADRQITALRYEIETREVVHKIRKVAKRMLKKLARTAEESNQSDL